MPSLKKKKKQKKKNGGKKVKKKNGGSAQVCGADEHDIREINPKAWRKRSQRDSQREARNRSYQEQLVAGTAVKFRMKGNLVWPRVKNGDWCRFNPVDDSDKLHVGDIVFAKVFRYPRECYTAGSIIRIMQEVELSEEELACGSAAVSALQPYRKLFEISDQHGQAFGQCYFEDIYGELEEEVLRQGPMSDGSMLTRLHQPHE